MNDTSKAPEPQDEPAFAPGRIVRAIGAREREACAELEQLALGQRARLSPAAKAYLDSLHCDWLWR